MRIKNIFLTCVLLFSGLLASAQESLLVTPQWLNDHKNDPNLVILQPNFLQVEYDQEHIAGARFLWPGWLAPDSPQGSMSAPDPDKINDIVGSLGISNNSTIVLCHVRNEVSPTARMFLVFEDLGMKGKVLFLNGGLEAWKKAGYPVTTEVPVVKKGKFKASINPILVDKDYVSKNLHSTSTVIVDARAKRFYDGDPVGDRKSVV